MSRLEQIPDVSFLGETTIAGLKEKAIEVYKAEYSKLKNTDRVIVSDEIKAILDTAAQIFFQLAEVADTKARQNLLKYAEENYLDNLAASKPLTRKKAEYAYTTVQFNLSAERPRVVAIPKGTRVTSQEGKIYFETEDYAEVEVGEQSVLIPCRCTTGGAAGNKFDIGELNILSDPIPYVASVTNIDATTGGADRESDDDFAERIFNSRMLFSTAGSLDAYIYYAKEFSSLVDDVKPICPNDTAHVIIYITLKDRTRASESFLRELKEYLENTEIKPLTDQIEVKNVERVNYKLEFTYKLYSSDISKAEEIGKAVSDAAEKYKDWQSDKIGRDINTQELIARVKDAGAAKVNVISPIDGLAVNDTEIAFCEETKISYEGRIDE